MQIPESKELDLFGDKVTLSAPEKVYMVKVTMRPHDVRGIKSQDFYVEETDKYYSVHMPDGSERRVSKEEYCWDRLEDKALWVVEKVLRKVVSEHLAQNPPDSLVRPLLRAARLPSNGRGGHFRG